MGLISEADAAERIARAVGEPVVIEELLVDLVERTCFRVTFGGRRAIAKFNDSPERSVREALALSSAAAGGVAVPVTLAHDQSPPALLVFEWVDGAPLGHEAGWREAGAQLAHLHSLAVPEGMPAYSDEHGSWRGHLLSWADIRSERCRRVGGLPTTELHAMRDSWLPILEHIAEPPRVFLHGDPQPDHFLLDPRSDHPVLIDWGDARTGDPLWDLSILLLDHPERREEVLAGYRPSPELAEHIDAHLDVYRLLRYVGEIAWLLERDFDATESIAGARSLAAALFGSD